MKDPAFAATRDMRESFEKTTFPFETPLYNTALRLTRRPEDAGDLVQDTYLRAYRTFINFELGTNCKAWLFTIMYSIFANKYRKEQRQPVSVSIDESEDTFQKALAVWDKADPTLISLEVKQALDDLPENFRTAILLVDIEEMSYEEAAEILNCPIGTVRSRLFRARKLMFGQLHTYAETQGYTLEANA